jgi:hypothetical protein
MLSAAHASPALLFGKGDAAVEREGAWLPRPGNGETVER